jgi:peptidyl-dipeptidase A
MRKFILFLLLVSSSFAQTAAKPARKPAARPTAAEAQKFVQQAEQKLLELTIKADQASWVQSNFITYDTEAIAADTQKELIAAATDLATQASRFNGLKLPYDTKRKLELLKLALTVPAPKNPKEQGELTEITVSMESDYGRGKYCPGKGAALRGPEKPEQPQGEPKQETVEPKPEGGEAAEAKDDCLDLTAMERILAENRNPQRLLELWRGWHAIAPPMRKRYQRYVELANKGAKEMGYADAGAMWRSKYDMPADDFAREVDRLWEQVKPLYLALHTYVRSRLVEKYGPHVVPPDGPIPAHLLGNMWAQSWGNIYDVAAPPASDPGYDLTKILQQRKTTERDMVRYGERFFTSLGFAPLPETFWERSLFTKPRDREVVCHASAWDVDQQNDLRIKMCIQVRDEDFAVIHHELGHNFYQRAYAHLPPLYRGSANDGFHEAVGDAIALSVTPEYLKQLGFIEKVPDPSGDVGLLMKEALDKVAFLPFGLLVDQWRWKVFSGEIAPADYNKAWWELRRKYQGVAAPVARTEQDFDPGAKYHVPANVPYTRYFLAHILQFQFHRAMCREAGFKGPLHRCSIYNNKEAGARLNKMLEMGQSRPWPEALEALTGEKQMDATAILDYFAPLKKWLDEQNKGKKTGW